jgi:hypothetical protein
MAAAARHALYCHFDQLAVLVHLPIEPMYTQPS